MSASSLDVNYRDYVDLVGVALLTLGAAALVIWEPPGLGPLRIALGLFAVLLAPGYSLMAALFPAAGEVQAPARLAGSTVLSFVLVAILGLAVDASPWLIGAKSMAVGALLATVIFASVAGLRRMRLPSHKRFGTSRDRQFWRALAACAGAFAVAMLAVGLLRPNTTYTELYVLGAEGRLSGYPNRLTPSETFELDIVVANREGRTMSYVIRSPYEPEDVPVQLPALAHGENWTASVAFEAPNSAGRIQVPIELYRQGDTLPYRTVYVFIDVG